MLLFWIAFIFTRPFGATFGDFLTKPLDGGGLNLPREYASLITLGVLALVLYVTTRKIASRERRRSGGTSHRSGDSAN